MAAPAWPQPQKTLLASEQLRPDMAERRKPWIEERQPAFARAGCVQFESDCVQRALYVEKQHVPALKPGQVVVADNLSSHKSPRVVELLTAKGSRIIFLPPYSPDLNPIKMAFCPLKTLIRKAAARRYQDLCKQVGRVCDPFTSQECSSHFRAAGYGCN